ncbi:nitronate monooxygenase [Heliophilum fasciatum]|uniref:Probable nitronate monooxygenase n=1 Tax=Heliophilum fasciatum TaxID=35700 RepID=A0A4V2SWY1_9FIRM|nr:nitronate monooxygenase [Heliophilum fasciatum]MCW2278106.1 enoyl-[acyl-carrier protein] reductase II [Heliophilum fasciatum]TCP64176.1 enoyl-[acyl-carrier protein] reductase II [Heliophilum fasciatum]
MKTRLTELLGIQYPVLQGAMVWISEANLTSAVSNAGGAGIIAAGGRTAEWLREEIRKTRELTDKPFGVNIMLMAPNKEEIVDVVCQEKVAFATLGAGNPVPFFEQLHGAGVKVIPVVPSVRLARRVEEKGADAVVIEGMEAAGHIGTLTTMALLTNVIPQVKIPVVAAGGIADGRGMAAALLMGASGVQMGSRFLLAEECLVHPNAKQKIIEATDTDSVVTGYSRGHGVRGLKNSFSSKYLALEVQGAPDEELTALATGTSKKAAIDGDVDEGFVQVGQSLNVLTRIEPVKTIIEGMVAEAKATLVGAPRLVEM